jgi:UPF0755 protein
MPQISFPPKTKFTKFQLKKSKRSQFAIAIVLVLFLFGILVWRELYLPPSQEAGGKTVLVKIEKGEGLADISSFLKEKGLIKSEFWFKLAAFLKGVQGRLQAGVYKLSPSMSISDILKTISEGEIAKERVTIPEGWSLKDIAWYFENQGRFQAEEIFEVAGFPGVDYSKNPDVPRPKDFSKEFDFLKDKPKNTSLEGYLFPDTYEILPQDTPEDIVKRMLENFGKKVTPDLREAIKRQGKTLYRVITMASILERELKNYEDKQIAAGILWKRLRNGWPLQVDATVSYLVGKPSKELTRKDLNIDSPYNTYKYRGLPLGPISNPGLESIKAAIYYKESPYWFYLTKPDDGRAVFSRTLREHAINKWKYLK